MEKLSAELSYKEIEICKRDISQLQEDYSISIEELDKQEKLLAENEKTISVSRMEIENAEKIKKQVKSLDICPLCKTKITPEHIDEVFRDCDDKVNKFSLMIKECDYEKAKEKILHLKNKLDSLKKSISKAEIDLIKLNSAEDKKESLKRLNSEKDVFKLETASLEKEIKNLEPKVIELSNIEEKSDRILLEIQEISSRTAQNTDSDLEYKQRDIEKFIIELKQL